MSSFAVTALTASIGFILANTSALADVAYQKVALKFDPAPGQAAGVLFSQYESSLQPMISPDGFVMFGFNLQGTGVTTTNKYSVWAGPVTPLDPADLRLIARAESQAQGVTAGLTYAAPGGVNWKGAIGTEGNIAYQGGLAGAGVTTSNDECIWAGPYTAPTLSYRESTAAPGLAGVNYGSLSSGRVMADGSSIAFKPVLTGGVTVLNDDAIFGGAPLAMSVIIREGSAAPGQPAGMTLYTLIPVGMAGAGSMVYQTSFIGNGWTTGNPQNALCSGGATVVKRTDPAPGMPAGAVFTGFSTSNFSCNSGGSVLYAGTVSGGGVNASNDQGLWLNGVMIHREGSQFPNLPAGVNIGGVGGSNMLAGSNIAMNATLTGTGVTTANDTALIVGTPGDFHMIAREGTQAVGKPAGVIYTNVNFGLPCMNGGGDLLWQCSLSGGGGGVDCVYAGSSAGINPILSIGDSFEVTPGVFRTINYIGPLYSGANGSDGKPASLNGPGQFVIALGFTDNSTGIFVGHLHPCDAPSISADPIDTSVCSDSPMMLSVTAEGAGLSYQWRKAGDDIDGATDATYSIVDADAADAGSYDVIVSNGCGQIISDTATVTVWSHGSGDLNADGELDGRDLQVFTATVMNPFAATDYQRCAADVDQTGSVDTFDVPVMVNLLINE